MMTGPRGLGHIGLVVGFYVYLLDWINVHMGSTPFATIGASKLLPSDMYLISSMAYMDNNYVDYVCHVIKLKFCFFKVS